MYNWGTCNRRIRLLSVTEKQDMVVSFWMPCRLISFGETPCLSKGCFMHAYISVLSTILFSYLHGKIEIVE